MDYPPKPPARAEKVSLWRYMRLFRQDILSAQPARLYRAWMAEFRTRFFRSYLINQPELIQLVLKTRPEDFPKSDRIAEGLRPLLGNSVFLTNDAEWEAQRRIIDPAFAHGRLKESFPALVAAGAYARQRLAEKQGIIEIESEMSHLAADVIFRTLFSIPIEDDLAHAVFRDFRRHQRSQPLLNLAAFIPVPSWVPRLFRRDTKETAQRIRDNIRKLTQRHAKQIAQGNAPQDLASMIMQTPDPQTGARFDTEEMLDQVAIFFLAGHETSASALSWALYLVARYRHWQDKIYEEVEQLRGEPEFSSLARLPITRDVFRETLRLYPPVPMMVRSARKQEHFRDRIIAKGSQIVISPWHLHRHERFWEDPDAFRPDRWQAKEEGTKNAYLPFSAGRRVCTGAGFAMMEGTFLLADLVRHFEFSLTSDPAPRPVAYLTVRAQNGIILQVTKRDVSGNRSQ